MKRFTAARSLARVIAQPWRFHLGLRLWRIERRWLKPSMIMLSFLLGVITPWAPTYGAGILVVLLILMRRFWRVWAWWDGLRLPHGRVVQVQDYHYENVEWEPIDASRMLALFPKLDEFINYGITPPTAQERHETTPEDLS